MHTFQSGWVFFKSAWKTGQQERILFLPVQLFAALSLALTVLILIPVGAIFAQPATISLFIGLTGFLGIVWIFALLVLQRLAFALVSRMFSAQLTASRPDWKAATAQLQHSWLDLAALALTAPLAAVFPGLLGRDTSWRRAQYLVVPVMVLENLALGAGLLRAGQMAQAKLLRISDHYIGVRYFGRVVGGILWLGGLLLAVLVGNLVLNGGPDSGLRRAGGILAGLLIFAIFGITALAINAYAQAVYHTCLYTWAVRTEKAHLEMNQEHVQPPALLATALGLAP
jgi:hypothetical protein